MTDSIIQLRCDCNNYPWGKKGRESAAARLCEKIPGTDFKIDDEKEYAEMWMGTYPTTPSYVLDSGRLLQDVLNENKEALIGKQVLDKYGTDLPFLPKILSIAKALPLQLHPNKELATKLHKKDPDQFGDPNHKPEIAVAFGPFEVFAGFKPVAEVQQLFNLPAFKDCGLSFPSPSTTWDSSTLRTLCRSMLEASESTVRTVSSAIPRLSSEDLGPNSYILDLLPRLQSQYSESDNGNLVALLTMNYLTLNAGDAIYIPADGIHAYLSGDIFECMARSDNVLNVGFCPAADRNSIETFTQTLTFDSVGKEDILLPSKPSQLSKKGNTVVYAPPLSEFNLLVTRLSEGKEEIGPVKGPSIMIVLEGEGTLKYGSDGDRGKTKDLKEGGIFFVGKDVEIEIESTGKKELVVYRAYAE